MLCRACAGVRWPAVGMWVVRGAAQRAWLLSSGRDGRRCVRHRCPPPAAERKLQMSDRLSADFKESTSVLHSTEVEGHARSVTGCGMVGALERWPFA